MAQLGARWEFPRFRIVESFVEWCQKKGLDYDSFEALSAAIVANDWDALLVAFVPALIHDDEINAEFRGFALTTCLEAFGAYSRLLSGVDTP